MSYQLINHPTLGQMIHEIMPNGLQVYLYPMEKLHSAYCILGTRVGSADDRYYMDGHVCTMPAGVAHFLEHKLFESEDGDLFYKFGVTGANANAYTGFDRTCYLFSCTENLTQSLGILLDQLQNPYLTPENVEKEKGIIAEEIAMYDDDAEWRSSFNLLQSLYVNNSVRIDIAGTKESIMQISCETLQNAYRRYYHPKNQCLAIAGNMDVEEVLAVCRKNCTDVSEFELQRVPVFEPREVNDHESVMHLPIAVPLVTLGYKEEVPADFITKIIDTLLIELLVGETTTFYKQAYDAGIIGPTFGTEVFSGDDYHALLFSCETVKYREFVSAIKERIEYCRQNGLPREDFELIKKSIYGRRVRGFTRPESVATSMMSAHFVGKDLFWLTDVMKDITFDMVQERFSSVLFEQYSAVSLILPEEE